MNSGLISRYASLIGEASKLGGDISVVIHRAAKDMDDMIRIENERRRQISMQATTIYISFAVLLIVTYLLINMYPSIGSLDLGIIGGSGLQGQAASAAPRMSYELVIRRFFHLILINSICAGLLIGLFSEGQLKYGLLHAIVMVIASTVFFSVMVF
jgi:flagellar protein FlaJ